MNSKSQNSNHKWFDKPFDRLTALSNVEELTSLSNVEGQLPAHGASACAARDQYSIRLRRTNVWIIGAWNLDTIFYLVLGAWNF
jgi:hypothetical protein